jgi:hypothetical protein
MKKILMITLMALLPMGAAARQLECSYDYVTHMTVHKITESISSASGLQCLFHHEVSPIGGKEMYIMEETPTTEGSCTDHMVNKVDENLYYWDDNFVRSLVLVDFEHVVLREFQFPKYYLERSGGEFSGTIVSWECRRID